MTGGMLYRVALGVTWLSAVAGLLAWLRTGRLSRWVWGAGGFACAATAGIAWGFRWREAGHLPIFGTYESALSLAFVVCLVALMWEGIKGRFRAGVVPVAALVAAGLLTQGARFDSTVYALTISERSLVVDAHALLAWGAFALLAVNAAVALRMVLSAEDPSARGEKWLVSTLEAGFLLHSGMLASGSLYKFMLFGKAWSFDPIETLGFVAWLSYGTLLHMKLLGGWRAKRLAGWCVFVFVLLVASYRLIVYFPGWATYHVFDIALRLHS